MLYLSHKYHHWLYFHLHIYCSDLIYIKNSKYHRSAVIVYLMWLKWYKALPKPSMQCHPKIEKSHTHDTLNPNNLLIASRYYSFSEWTSFFDLANIIMKLQIELTWCNSSRNRFFMFLCNHHRLLNYLFPVNLTDKSKLPASL